MFVCRCQNATWGMQNMIGIFGITFDRLNIVLTYYNKGLCLYEKKILFKLTKVKDYFFYVINVNNNFDLFVYRCQNAMWHRFGYWKLWYWFSIQIAAYVRYNENRHKQGSYHPCFQDLFFPCFFFEKLRYSARK